MADISQEIAAFQNAVYGEEVRGSMISLAEKLNDVCEDTESTVNSFESSITTAINNANTATSAANTAASNANTKATAANTAATNANTATSAANDAATAANNAASAATTTNNNITSAESARVSAENARATAEATRQANEQSRQTAETARVNAESARASAESSRSSAESQRQSNESTRQGNETIRQTQEGLRVSAESSRVSEFEDMQAAFADMQQQIIPQATESTMGGVIVGGGLNVENALLSLATTKSGSGTAVASNGAVLESVVVYGESVQDGTPTPSAPVEVQVVEGRNLVNNSVTGTNNGITYTYDGRGGVLVSGTATSLATLPVSTFVNAGNVIHVSAGTYTLSIHNNPSGVMVQAYSVTESADKLTTSSNNNFTVSSDSDIVVRVRVASGTTVNANVLIQLEAGSAATPYVPYGSIGIVIGDTATPIDLQGNVLASLPDGTRDTLTVDSAGHGQIDGAIGIKEITSANITSAVISTSYSNIMHAVTDIVVPAGRDNVMSNMFRKVSGTFSSNSYNGEVCGAYSDGTVRFNVDVSRLSESTLNGVKAWANANKPLFYYPLPESQLIDLGYIDMPTIPEDATISVNASITPVIDASWWERGAEALANIVKAFSERIKALEEAVAEIATA